MMADYVKDLNTKLKDTQTYEDFKVLEKAIKDSGLGIYSKRGNKCIFNITHLYDETGIFKNHYAGLESSKNRVHYLYDDGVSEGKAYVKNLYKFFEIR